jgi:hypothetical protein
MMTKRTYLPKANARPGSFTASANNWSLMVRSPILKWSREMNPSMEPDPYLISKDVPFFLWVEEELESNFVWRKHAIEVHLTLGTQRLLELKTDVSVTRDCRRKELTQCLG